MLKTQTDFALGSNSESIPLIYSIDVCYVGVLCGSNEDYTHPLQQVIVTFTFSPFVCYLPNFCI